MHMYQIEGFHLIKNVLWTEMIINEEIKILLSPILIQVFLTCQLMLIKMKKRGMLPSEKFLTTKQLLIRYATTSNALWVSLMTKTRRMLDSQSWRVSYRILLTKIPWEYTWVYYQYTTKIVRSQPKSYKSYFSATYVQYTERTWLTPWISTQASLRQS